MDQNQTIDSDLQKAIDDITKTTSVDPVFSDPVAAPSSVPEGDTGELDSAVGPFPEPEPISIPEPMTMPEPAMMPEPVMPTKKPVMSKTMKTVNVEKIRKSALRDLTPILGNMKLEPLQKFRIYRAIYETVNDYTVLAPAYEVAREIANENERGEALLYLIESIDKM